MGALTDGPAVLVDVDGVLFPTGPPAMLKQAGYRPHHYEGYDRASGTFLDGEVWLHADHGVWLRELAAQGAALGWATGWRQAAADILAPYLGLPADMPVLDVGTRGGSKSGRSFKGRAVRRWAGRRRPFAWLDDGLGFRDPIWETKRIKRGGPTLLVPVEPRVGLTRGHIDRVAERNLSNRVRHQAA